jgi:hypothetical protein
LDSIIPAVLAADLKKLEGELSATARMGSFITATEKAELFQQLTTLISMLEAHPLSSELPAHTKNIHELAAKCEGAIQSNQLYTRIRRLQVMLSLLRACQWVEIDIAHAVWGKLKEDTVTRKGRPHDWLDDMIGILVAGLSNGVRGILINPMMYPRLRAFSAEKFTFNNSHSPYRYVGHKTGSSYTTQ